MMSLKKTEKVLYKQLGKFLFMPHNMAIDTNQVKNHMNRVFGRQYEVICDDDDLLKITLIDKTNKTKITTP